MNEIKEKMTKVLQILSDCYTNNKPFDYKLIPQEEWKKFTEEFDVTDEDTYDLTSNPSKEQIFDFVYEAIGYYEFDAETICSFSNLSLALMTDYNVAKFIIEKKVRFKEFVRPMISSFVLPIEQIKFSDILYHFNGSFENWQTDTSISDGSLLVSLCDYLGVKVETIEETPVNWSVPEYEFEEFENKDDLKKFSRLFRKPMNKWYGDRWCDV